MGLFETVAGFAKGIVKPALDLVDEIHTSDHERLTVKATLQQLENAVTIRMAEIQASLIESQHKLMTAETQSDGWITRAWRPLAGLGFVAIIFIVYGKPAIMGQTVTVELPSEFWWAMSGVLGIAIGGRSVEKAAKHLKK